MINFLRLHGKTILLALSLILNALLGSSTVDPPLEPTGTVTAP